MHVLDKQTGERKSYSGCFLVSAEGGASSARKQLGMILTGNTYEDRFLLCGSTIDYAKVFKDIGPVAYLFHPSEWAIIMQQPTKYMAGTSKTGDRTVFKLAPDSNAEEEQKEENVRKRLKRLIANQDAEFDISFVSYYSIHRRVADTFREGRVLLTGDAAHNNNPHPASASDAPLR